MLLVATLGLLMLGCSDDDEAIALGSNGGAANNSGSSIILTTAGLATTAARFLDVSATGQSLPLGDDDSAAVPLPFAVVVNGQTFSSVRVSSNGFLTFGTQNDTFANTGLPSPNAPDPLLAVYWDDLSPPAVPWVFTQVQGNAPNRQFIVQWKNAQSPFLSGNDGITFEAIVSETGRVELQYQDISFGDAAFNAGASATVGFQAGNVTSLWCFNGAPNSLPSNSGLLVHP